MLAAVEMARVGSQCPHPALPGREQHRRSPVPTGQATDPVDLELSLRGRTHAVEVANIEGSRWLVGPAGAQLEVVVDYLDDVAVILHLGGRQLRALVHRGRNDVAVDVDGSLHRVRPAGAAVVRAPGPALLVDLSVAVGDVVEAGSACRDGRGDEDRGPPDRRGRGSRGEGPGPAGHPGGGGSADRRARTAGRRPHRPHPPRPRSTPPGRGPRSIGATPVAAATRCVPWMRSCWVARSRRQRPRRPGTSWICCRATRGATMRPGLRSSTGSGCSTTSRRCSNATSCCWTTIRLRSAPNRRSTRPAALHHRGDDAVRAELRPLLAAAVAHHGVTGFEPTNEYRAALWRLAATRSRTAERERLMTSAIRAVAALARRGAIERGGDLRRDLATHRAIGRRLAARPGRRRRAGPLRVGRPDPRRAVERLRPGPEHGSVARALPGLRPRGDGRLPDARRSCARGQGSLQGRRRRRQDHPGGRGRRLPA